MSDQRAYCRVYWSIVDDPKFADVYDNDAALATWLRLLIIADQAWPASASLPASAKRRVVDLLASVGLVDTMPGWRYRIHGLDAERDRRADSARKGAAVRWQSERIAAASSVRMPSLAEPSQDEPSTANAGASDPADIYWQLTGKFPTDKVLPWIDQLTEEYGADPVIRYLADEHQRDRNAMTLMGRVSNRLRADARQLSLKERAAEKQRIGERRRDPAVLRAYHNTGAHQQPEPGCPLCQEAAA